MNKNLVFLIVFGLSLFWAMSLFIAPMTLAPDTVKGLNGNANIVDYADQWDDLPPYHRAIYYFGDFNCHQKWTRSFTINNNQMPVDARMTSIFAFANFGFLSMMFVEVDHSMTVTMMNAFPRGFKRWVQRRIKPMVFMSILTVLAFLPVAVDGFTQLLTPYESNNLTRVLTGISMGWIGGMILGALILTASMTKKSPYETIMDSN
jgi:uncharacterized membrane protein